MYVYTYKYITNVYHLIKVINQVTIHTYIQNPLQFCNEQYNFYYLSVQNTPYSIDKIQDFLRKGRTIFKNSQILVSRAFPPPTR